MRRFWILLAFSLLLTTPAFARPERSAREALQAFQDLIGSWRGTGVPQGSREEKDRGFWQETISWQWQFKGKEVWLRADIDKGKHYSRFDLRYLPASDAFSLEAITPGKQTHTYTGKFADKRLSVERTDPTTKQVVKLVFSLLHENRHLYSCEIRPAGSTVFQRQFQVGATKQGVAFATEDRSNECIVSGGKGTSTVTYKGKTYYVCCTGCRDAFNDEPEKYVREYEARKKEKKD